jgi:hypothetical protein
MPDFYEIDFRQVHTAKSGDANRPYADLWVGRKRSFSETVDINAMQALLSSLRA